jgi:ATP-dependent DNA helicase RecG
MITLEMPLEQVPGAGKALSRALATKGVRSVRDLLFYFPYRYLDFSQTKPIKDIKAGDTVTVRGSLKTIASRWSFRGRMGLAEGVVSDATGSLKVVWFNQPYLAKTLKPGDEILLAGTVQHYKTLQLQNPIYEKFSDDSIHTGRLVPVYHTTENLYNRTVRSLVKQCLPLAEDIKDIIPPAILKNFGLMPLSAAVAELHFPTTRSRLQQAEKRAIFDEVLVQQLAVQMHKRQLEQSLAPRIPAHLELIKQFLSTLPFTLTVGQKRALWEVIQDIDRPASMNRLLEGDVGSGKTVVAVAASLETAAAGFQAAILAPTEILARQHYESFRHYLGNYPYPVGLFTRNFQLVGDGKQTKTGLWKKVHNGEVAIVIGTHALLQQGAKFHKLGLVVIDEQHRFGVQQRGALIKLGASGPRPHLLSMSATPIPRTLALSIYSDLAISRLVELPGGRKAIVTKVVKEDERTKAYAFIAEQLTAGRQAFVVTPRVEESETSTIKSAKAEVTRLQQDVFPGFKIGLIHGKMSGAEKERIMAQFYNQELDILVATSVIEIGIDVPNATVMLIEDADRFGLAQLHQLRGRVGRGAHASYCLLFTQAETPESIERLKLFGRTQDGFKLAELDLEQRGFGSLFGSQQTGYDFKYSRYLTMDVLKIAQQAAAGLLNLDPSLKKHPQLRRLAEPLLEQIHLE